MIDLLISLALAVIIEAQKPSVPFEQKQEALKLALYAISYAESHKTVDTTPQIVNSVPTTTVTAVVEPPKNAYHFNINGVANPLLPLISVDGFTNTYIRSEWTDADPDTGKDFTISYKVFSPDKTLLSEGVLTPCRISGKQCLVEGNISTAGGTYLQLTQHSPFHGVVETWVTLK